MGSDTANKKKKLKSMDSEELPTGTAEDIASLVPVQSKIAGISLKIKIRMDA